MRPGRLVRLVLIAETVVLAGSVAAALHYRGEDSQLGHGRQPVAWPGQLPRLASVTFRLPPDGPITGTVLITAATQDGAQRAQFVVSATILGGHPGTVYDLTGNDCSAAAPVPDHVWAAGETNAAWHGRADRPPMDGTRRGRVLAGPYPFAGQPCSGPARSIPPEDGDTVPSRPRAVRSVVRTPAMPG